MSDMNQMQHGDMHSYESLQHGYQKIRKAAEYLRSKLLESQQQKQILERRVLQLQEDNGRLRTQMNNLYMSRGAQFVNGGSFPLGHVFQLTPQLTPELNPAAFQQQSMQYTVPQTIDLTGDNEVDAPQQVQAASVPFYAPQGNLADCASLVPNNNVVSGDANSYNHNYVQFNAPIVNSNVASGANRLTNNRVGIITPEISSTGGSNNVDRPAKRRRVEAPEWMPGYSNRALNSAMNNMTGNIAREETQWSIAEAQRLAREDAMRQSLPLPTSTKPAQGSTKCAKKPAPKRSRTEGQRATKTRRPNARTTTPAAAANATAAPAAPTTQPTPQPIQAETTKDDKEDWDEMWEAAYESFDKEEEERQRVEAAGIAAVATVAATEEAEHQVSSDQNNTSTGEPLANMTSEEARFFDFTLFGEDPDDNEAHPAIQDCTANQQETTAAPVDQQSEGVDAQPMVNNIDDNLGCNNPGLDIGLDFSLSNNNNNFNFDINTNDFDSEFQQVYEGIMNCNAQDPRNIGRELDG